MHTSTYPSFRIAASSWGSLLGAEHTNIGFLPFCLALSPPHFHEMCRLRPWHLFVFRGIRIMNYIDNWLILAQSHQAAVRHRDVILPHMTELGLWLNAKKSVFLLYRWPLFLAWHETQRRSQGAPVTGTYIVHPVGCKKYKARPVTHCQTGSEDC